MMHTAPGPRPKESVFYEPVLYLLGKLTGFKPYVGVRHEDIRDDVLRLAGLDLIPDPAIKDPKVRAKAPITHATDGTSAWPLRSASSSKRDGLYRIVHFGWYHQTRQYRRSEKTLCGKPAYPIIDHLDTDRWELLDISEDERESLRDPHTPAKEKQRVRRKMKKNRAALDEEDTIYLKVLDDELRELQNKARGEWALTELGVKKAKALREKFEGRIVLSAGPNATARFLGDNWDTLWGRVTLHLRRKMPRSEEFGKIEDHAMGWMERVMQRDGLRSRIEDGKSIPPSQVQAWARRGAYTDIRNEGREPCCRVFHGALTKKEIALYDPSNWTEVIIPRTINESDNLSVNTYAEHSENDFVGDPIDNLRDDHVTADVEGSLLNEDAFNNVLDHVAEILHDEIDPDLDPTFHERIMVERFVKEMTLDEIAAAHGLNNKREVTVSLNRVRDVMLRAREEGDFDHIIRR